VISVVDPEARHTRKSRSHRRDGYRGHVAAEPDTGLITDCELTKAAGQAGSDPVVGEQMISRDRYHQATGKTATTSAPRAAAEPAAEPAAEHGAAEAVGTGHDPAPVDAEGETGTTEPAGGRQAGPAEEGRGLQVYADSAYGTGDARAAYRAGGHDTMIKPKPLRPAVAGGFTLDDFTVDERAGTVTCPGGHTRTMSATRTVTFGAVCAGCPLRPRCTTATDGRSMTIHPHQDLLRAARAQARTPQFKQAYPTRSAIERVIAWTATQNGRRVRLRYLGASKNNAWLRTRCAALNLRTLINHGLTRHNGVWTLA
jgi:hypothetical protein